MEEKIALYLTEKEFNALYRVIGNLWTDLIVEEFKMTKEEDETIDDIYDEMKQIKYKKEEK